MDPVSVIAMVGTIAGTINSIGEQIMAIKSIIDQIKGADATLMSLVAQLSTIKAALTAIKDLIQIAKYDEQLQMDLELSVRAAQVHIDFIDEKISKLKTKHAASTLKLRSKIRVVFESEDMEKCLDRLNHQAVALNLLITVLTAQTVHEQKAMLQRSNTRKVFKKIEEDTATLMDEAASIMVLRDEESVRNAQLRSQSEPIITKNPWKRFAFDSQIRASRAYGGKLLRRISDQDANHQHVIEEEHRMEEEDLSMEADSLDDAETLVEEPESLLQLQTPHSKRNPGMYEKKLAPAPRYSKMLAFGHDESDISGLVAHAQHLWQVSDLDLTQQPSNSSTKRIYRLSTRYFDVSIHAHTFEEYRRQGSNDELLASYRDVSSILFVVNLEEYHYDNRKLEQDLELFRRTVNDYHLWLAKIVLFLNTANLDPYSTQGLTNEMQTRFMRAGGTGATDDRIHVVTGEADEMTAGTIFAVTNEDGRVQSNKWAGLTKSPTY